MPISTQHQAQPTYHWNFERNAFCRFWDNCDTGSENRRWTMDRVPYHDLCWHSPAELKLDTCQGWYCYRKLISVSVYIYYALETDCLRFEVPEPELLCGCMILGHSFLSHVGIADGNGLDLSCRVITDKVVFEYEFGLQRNCKVRWDRKSYISKSWFEMALFTFRTVIKSHMGWSKCLPFQTMAGEVRFFSSR